MEARLLETLRSLGYTPSAADKPNLARLQKGKSPEVIEFILGKLNNFNNDVPKKSKNVAPRDPEQERRVQLYKQILKQKRKNVALEEHVLRQHVRLRKAVCPYQSEFGGIPAACMGAKASYNSLRWRHVH